jgi:perosamine synthetase
MEPYQQLEKEYAAFTGSRYAASCSSGTAALHLALLAVGVGKGDEVIVPDFTMAACAFAVSYCNAKPVFVDVLSDTYGINPGLIEKAITKKTKAIMVVHVYGRLADMDAILKIAKKHRLPVIEDACEAQGAVYKSKATATVFSLYRNKIVHAEEGGIITTDDKKIVDKVNYLKNMAFGRTHDYFHTEIGYNYRLSNAQALLAMESLRGYVTNNKKRRTIEKWYSKYLDHPMRNRDAVWFYELAVAPGSKRKILKKVTQARDSFKPLSSFPMYGGRIKKTIASELADSLILLPASPNLTEQNIRDICLIINSLA